MEGWTEGQTFIGEKESQEKLLRGSDKTRKTDRWKKMRRSDNKKKKVIGSAKIHEKNEKNL